MVSTAILLTVKITMDYLQIKGNIMAYPATIASLSAKSDGPSNIIYAAHINANITALKDLRTVLGDAPQGNLADLESRLDVRIDDDGKLKQPQQFVTVGKTNCDYTTISAALAAITDAASNKKYCVFVYPGIYSEFVTMKDHIDLVGCDRDSCIISPPAASRGLDLAESMVSNISIISTRNQAAVYSGNYGSGSMFNCYISSSGATALLLGGDNPVFVHCTIIATGQLYIDHGAGYPSFFDCTITPSAGNGGESDDDMIQFYRCVISASDNQFTVNAGAYAELRFCILGEEFAGEGTVDKGVVDGTCTTPA